MLRRVFDQVDMERQGEICAKQFEAWLHHEGGLLAKVARPEVMHSMCNDDDSNQEVDCGRNHTTTPKRKRRLSAIRREQLLVESKRTVLAHQITRCVENDIVRGDWVAAFLEHDYTASGKI